MRVLGVEYGRSRIGLALSDPSGILASPWRTVGAGADPAGSAMVVADLVRDAGRDDEPIALVVVGLPLRLNGSENEQTAGARAFAVALGTRAGLPVHFQDERLSSREAESRLALRERDWRRRKERIDAAAAAIILQDFLDARAIAVPLATDTGSE